MGGSFAAALAWAVLLRLQAPLEGLAWGRAPQLRHPRRQDQLLSCLEAIMIAELAREGGFEGGSRSTAPQQRAPGKPVLQRAPSRCNSTMGVSPRAKPAVLLHPGSRTFQGVAKSQLQTCSGKLLTIPSCHQGVPVITKL